MTYTYTGPTFFNGNHEVVNDKSYDILPKKELGSDRVFVKIAGQQKKLIYENQGDFESDWDNKTKEEF